MADPGQLSPSVFYRLAAEIGFRRHFHFGGLEATAQLMNLCLLEANHRVLDIGCASGKTACHVAGRYGCRVTGVDVLPEMIARANERAQREGVQDRVLFHAADARNLPFEAGLFDVVIGEFIVGLLDDRDKGVGEALRVARPGGIVGLNEATWLATPVPEDVVRYMSGTFGVKGGLLTAAEWVDLLNGVGLRTVTAAIHRVSTRGSWRDGLGDLARLWPRLLWLAVTHPTFRKILGETVSLPKNLFHYFGYGIYIGRKAA